MPVTKSFRRPADAPAPPAPDWALRAVDITIAALALAVLAPFLGLICLAIKRHDSGPALFAHRRIGRDGQVFRCWKLRTMVVDAEQKLLDVLANDATARAEWDRDRKLRVDPRVTRLGCFLRKTSIDELPQLLNVLHGKMSIVGPRPIVPSEIPLYGRAFNSYCSVRPGLTGLWQISGRNDVTYRRRVALDVVYTRKRSLAFNLWIVALTIPAVVFERGSY